MTLKQLAQVRHAGKRPAYPIHLTDIHQVWEQCEAAKLPVIYGHLEDLDHVEALHGLDVVIVSYNSIDVERIKRARPAFIYKTGFYGWRALWN